MSEVSSNGQVARQLATQLFTGLDFLNSSAVIAKDGETTVAGNANAQSAIDSLTAAITQISNTIEAASNNLTSVANEFESADQATRQLFSSSLAPIGKAGK